MCLKISGGVKQVLNVLEDCKAIPYVGNLIKFSGIPEDFGRMHRPHSSATPTRASYTPDPPLREPNSGGPADPSLSLPGGSGVIS